MTALKKTKVVAPIPTTVNEAFLSEPQPDWVVRDLLRRGDIAVPLGPSGSGKTFVFAVDLACSVLSGEPWLRLATMTGPVVVLAYEGQRGLPKRIEAWLRRGGAGDHVTRDAVLGSGRFTVYVKNPPAIGVPRRNQGSDLVLVVAAETFETLLEQLRQLQPVLVIIDPKIGAARLLSENSPSDTQVFVDDVRRIIDATGAAGVVIHHPGKRDKDLRGSSVLRGAADVIMWLEDAKATTGADRRVEFTKVKDDVTPAPRLLRFEEVDLQPDADGPRRSLRVVYVGEEDPKHRPGRASKGCPKVHTDRGLLDQRALVIANALLAVHERGFSHVGNKALRLCVRSAYGLEEGQPTDGMVRRLLTKLRKLRIAACSGQGRSAAWAIESESAGWVKGATWRADLPQPQEGWWHETDAGTDARDPATDSRRFGKQRESRAKPTRTHPRDGLPPSETDAKPTRNQRKPNDAPGNRRASSPRRGERARDGSGLTEDVATEDSR